MNPIIEMKNIMKVYGTTVKTKALDNIDLSFEAGSFNAIIGQSGSGKSTLLNIIGTLDNASSGDLLINGQNIKQLSRNQLSEFRNSEIGFVFQFHYLLPEFTALENVLMPYLIKHGKTNKEIVQRANELMELVGLENVKNNNATKMSGGQQQRTAIARALINNPRIILADEPTGNLDTDSTNTIYEIMRKINETMGTCFIIITHDKKIAERTDRIIEIKDGKIVLDVYK